MGFHSRYNTKLDVEAAVLSTPYYGSFTNTSGGLWRVINDQFQQDAGDRSNVDNVCVVITDGYSNLDENLLEPYAQQAMVGQIFKCLEMS